MAKAYNTSVL